MDTVNAHVDQTIINVCEYIEKISKDMSSENAVMNVAENTKALALLVLARAFDRSVY